MIEIRHIRYFLAVAEEGNFTRAAERCGIQQPPLSKQIADLERMVGAKLFQRVPQGAKLTEAGQAFLDVAKHLPAQIDRAANHAQQAARGELGLLRIGYPGGAAFSDPVTTSIRAFVNAYPSVELSFEEANTPMLRRGLSSGEYDIAFVRHNAEDIPDLKIETLGEEALMAVLPSSHVLADRPDIGLADLQNGPFILLAPQAGPILNETIFSTCFALGFHPHVQQTVSQIGSVINLVEAGLGVSLVPASLSCIQRSGVVFRPLSGQAPSIALGLAYRKGETRPLVRNFLTCVRGILNPNGRPR
ncbi:LysR family transcriptional regulator [Arenibacterium sp. LLYu02]|uniref:LysR family transcriptional regulator n=1 Tax=Arenibacterium sp. LLYu02 TaxID=3404132 RepID=UPI003B20BA9F